VATITLKNIPAELHRELKKRAEGNHRSLNKEIIATLRNAASGTKSVRQARALFRRPVTAREIDRWKRKGRLSPPRANVICVHTNIVCYRYMASPFSTAADAV